MGHVDVDADFTWGGLEMWMKFAASVGIQAYIYRSKASAGGGTEQEMGPLAA
jgi:hypothetical protein